MEDLQQFNPTRRSFLKSTGHLLIGFNLLPLTFCQTKGAPNEIPPYTGVPLRPSIDNKLIDSWIRLDAEGHLTVLSGKQELGQGIKIALIQIAAEELDINPDRCHIINSDTGQTANEGFTAGSNSVEGSGSAIRQAAAEARYHLLKMAGQKLNVNPDVLRVDDGDIIANTGEKVSYWELLQGKYIEEKISGDIKPKKPENYKYVGQPLHRDDIRKLVTGESHFVHDLQMPGMVHARVLHPPSYNATLQSIDLTQVKALQGVLKVISNGSFLAVIAEREYQAVKAREMLKELAVWAKSPIKTLPDQLRDDLLTTSGKPEEVEISPGIAEIISNSAIHHQADYFRPYHMHASMGPSCAVALWEPSEIL